MRKLIAYGTAPGELAVDPFAGSGAVAEACVKLERRCSGAEIDDRYAAPAQRRLTKAVERKRNSLFHGLGQGESFAGEGWRLGFSFAPGSHAGQNADSFVPHPES